MLTWPGEGVLATPREIFSFRARSLATSDSNAANRCCNWRFVFSKLVMWFVATRDRSMRFIEAFYHRQDIPRSSSDTLLLFWFVTGSTSLSLA